GLAASGGGPLDVRQATRRYLAAWIGPAAGFAAYGAIGVWGLVVLPLNYYWGWLDRERQFLHDRLAGTRVILD
ncbi:MAG: RDD family protein, partial [Betaproteobacteria bacterium]|nr:RDD family protein [Betaproteobacteria bacterium]